MEIRYSKLDEHYWGEKGTYQEQYDKLYEELVPGSGEADTLPGKLLRAISRLYYDYCNNGNCNVLDNEIDYTFETCWECGGTGEIEGDDYDEELEEYITVSCDHCLGEGEYETECDGEIKIEPFYQEFLDLLCKYCPSAYKLEDLLLSGDVSYGCTNFSDETMNVYDRVVDEVIHNIIKNTDLIKNETNA